MAEIKPFKATRYNKEKISSFSKLVCPPYDIIPNSEQKRYYRLSPYNIIRLILGKTYPSDTKENNRYRRAVKYLNVWIRKKILLKDTKEGIYFYQQRYRYQGRQKCRLGFIALLKIDEGMIYPHEHTHLKPKEDRLELLKQVKSNLSPVFVIFADSGNYISKINSICHGRKPEVVIRDKDGITNRLWILDDRRCLEKLSSYMQDKDIFIADGHHRFEVACAYRDMLKCNRADFSEDAPYNYIMAYFTDMNSKNLTIMATHRLIKDLNTLDLRGPASDLLEGLAENFLIERLRDKKTFLSALGKFSNLQGVFGMYFKDNFYLLRLKQNRVSGDFESLDVSLFNKFILGDVLKLSVEDKNIIYSADIGEAIKLIDNKKAKVAFFLSPTKINQLKDVVLRKQRLPPKSTYFYPKLLSGLVIHKFD